jgi:hypothetical protein
MIDFLSGFSEINQRKNGTTFMTIGFHDTFGFDVVNALANFKTGRSKI